MKKPKPPLWERDPERYREKAKKRILAKVDVDPETECWNWKGAVNVGPGNTYASARGSSIAARQRPYIYFEGRNRLAYRAAYQLWRGDIPEGLGMDHEVCAAPLCCNPWHVEPVTTQENTRRYWARRNAEAS